MCACTLHMAVSMGISMLGWWINVWCHLGSLHISAGRDLSTDPPFAPSSCPQHYCWQSWREDGCSGPCGATWSTTVVLLPHLRLCEMALRRAKLQGESSPLAWCDGMECKLLASQHWSLSLFLLSPIAAYPAAYGQISQAFPQPPPMIPQQQREGE